MKRLLFIMITVGFLAGAADAVFITYTGPDGGVWDDPCNWDLGRVPDWTLDDRVQIRSGAVNISTAQQISGLRLSMDAPGATLNIFDGADLYSPQRGPLLCYGTGAGAANVNMYGGTFRNIPSLGAWAAANYGTGGMNWYQEGGTATFGQFRNQKAGDVNIVVVGGKLTASRIGILSGAAGQRYDMYVASGGVMEVNRIDLGNGTMTITLDVSGTFRVRTAYLANFESIVTYLGTPVITVDGLYTQVHVIPEPATIALLGIGSMLMIRRRK